MGVVCGGMQSTGRQVTTCYAQRHSLERTLFELCNEELDFGQPRPETHHALNHG
jgi:hypothetical protein